MIKETLKAFNSFDYVFSACLLWNMYLGYSQGFRMMLYQTVKWIILFIGLFVADMAIYIYLIKIPWFLLKSAQINALGREFVKSFAPKDNILALALHIKVAEIIPYDKIVFYFIIIVSVIVLTRIFILGGLFEDEVEGRVPGALFGLLKAAFTAYILMLFIRSFMSLTNPEAFETWQKNSYILSHLGIKF